MFIKKFWRGQLGGSEQLATSRARVQRLFCDPPLIEAGHSCGEQASKTSLWRLDAAGRRPATGGGRKKQLQMMAAATFHAFFGWYSNHVVICAHCYVCYVIRSRPSHRASPLFCTLCTVLYSVFNYSSIQFCLVDKNLFFRIDIIVEKKFKKNLQSNCS